MGLVSWRWAVVGAAAAVVVVAVAATGVAERAELPLRDAALRGLSGVPATRVAAVVVDEAALAAVGPWPWERRRLAELVRGVAEAGAAGVVLDVLLVETRPGDETLAAALSSLPAVLVAAPDERATGWLAPPPALRGAARLGHGIFELDHDGVLRRVTSTKQMGGVALPAVSVAAVTMASPDRPVPVGRVMTPGFRVSPESVPVVSAAVADQEEGLAALAGRVVFIGLTAAGLGDRVVTPATRGLRPDPGVLVQAAVTESLLAGDVLRPLPPLAVGLPAALLVLAAGGLSRLGGWRRLVADGVLLLAPAILGLACLHAAGVVLPMATLSVLALAAVLAVEVRLGLLTWRHAGTTAALLAGEGASVSSAGHGSPEDRLELVEELATLAARRRLAEEESRRVVAHELKTPLTSVRGLGQMLRDLDLSEEERRRAADLLVAETGRLQEMIERLLELERLSLRRFDEVAGRVDLSALVGSRIELLRQGHGRALHSEIQSGLAALGDVGLLGRVVDNLVGNAFKFSPPESPVVVKLLHRGGELLLVVTDRGCGVAPEEQEAIFQRFRRGTRGTEVGGLGLGLALVHEVVTWHRGRVEVTSSPGAGSTFTVVLPAAKE